MTVIGDPRRIFVAVLLAAIVASSCGLGDESVAVVFVNETAGQVTVYPHGRNYPASHRLLAPSESAKDQLLYQGSDPEGVVADLEAVGPGDALVFCHVYTFGELRKLDGVIRIRSGTLDCRH